MAEGRVRGRLAQKLPNAIRDVAVSAASINPTAHQTASIGATFAGAGRTTVVVIDRDGYPVRTLAADEAVPAGRSEWQWDGRDDTGAVVPDEAYSLKIDWRSGAKRATYFPADAPAAMESIPVRYYDRQGGTLLYVLPRASRVHVQAGSAVVDRRTKAARGPVLKTVVNREPRLAGSIAEHWNGLDESGAIYVPDLRHFVISVAATPLPESSIITIGNRSRSFLDAVALRRGRSLFTYRVASHAHHAGLPATADVSPGLKLRPANARWSAADGAWTLDSGSRLRLEVAPTGAAAAGFAAQPGEVFHFVNYELTGRSAGGPAPRAIDVPAGALRCGVNTISVNWRSEYGTVAASSLRVLVQRRPRGGSCSEVSR